MKWKLMWKKAKIKRISTQPFSGQITIHQTQMDNVEYFNCLGSMITNYARCARKIKFKIFMQKAAFNRKKTLCTRTLGLNLWKTLVKC